MKPRLSVREYVDGVLSGDRAVLARAITLVESSHPADSDIALDILDECLPHAGKSIRVGITGVPGAGKSSVIDALGTYLTEEQGEKVAVLAVDPSSQISGGSILGDKTRMEKLAVDERAFIRPSPSGGTLGGVARRTRESMLLCEAAGYRNVIVETIGVGQSETAVRTMVDFFLLLAISGAGDELQGMKRGITEMTDLVAVNKADGDNRARAERTRRDYENALHLFPPKATDWTPRAVTCSALTREGIPELWQQAIQHNNQVDITKIRQEQLKTWMHEIIDQGLRDRFQPQIRQLEQEVAANHLTPFRAAQRLLKKFGDTAGKR